MTYLDSAEGRSSLSDPGDTVILVIRVLTPKVGMVTLPFLKIRQDDMGLRDMQHWIKQIVTCDMGFSIRHGTWDPHQHHFHSCVCGGGGGEGGCGGVCLCGVGGCGCGCVCLCLCLCVCLCVGGGGGRLLSMP